MSRKVLLQLVLPLIGLSVLFWLLAFAPGDKHHQPALLEMSVILRDGDGNVSAMRKGMEQAAKDLNVELRFLTPAEDNSAVEQVQLLEHEVSGAAPAILLIPADREALGEAVSAAAGKTTLVTVESDMTAWGADASISMDHQALGEALGKATLNGVPFGGTVLLLDASKLGTKEKVDGKNQRTVLSDDEITRIIDIFNAGKAEEDFCVAVSYADIEAKKLSFSAGQYFEVKIEYEELTPEEFEEKMNGFTARLDEMFAESRRLEESIQEQLRKVKLS